MGLNLDMATFWWDDNDDCYCGKIKINNQSILIKFEEIDRNLDTIYFNIVATVFSKRKHIEDLHQKELISGKNSIEIVINALKLFDTLELKVIEKFQCMNIVIICQWYNNKRRNAYWKILKKRGYQWGIVDNKKALVKKIANINRRKNEY